MIKQLPATTVRTLASAQSLLSPVSIVKELVDNALDARASSIHVEIDATTVGSLLVRDNGTGVRAADRDLMCLPHTTSKISAFSDIASVGTLGFRGEALSSLAEIAGALEISTRCGDEAVGEKWHVDRSGARVDARNTSATVGTTVSAARLYSHVPVRVAMYKKCAKKTISQIRQLLASYALLHRNLRVSFKVARSVAPVTVYAGGLELRDAVVSCYGRQCAGESQFVSKTVDGWQFECVLPRASDGGGECKHAVYAIDKRVLSVSLPTARKMAKCARKWIKSRYGTLVMLAITTPGGEWYDVNVEPAKDDVLLSNEEWVLHEWESILQGVYAEEAVEDVPVDEVTHGMAHDPIQEVSSASADGWMVSMLSDGQDQNEDVPVHEVTHGMAHDPVQEVSSASADSWMVSMLSNGQDQNEVESEEEDYRDDPELHNPWMVAKMNRFSKSVNAETLVDSLSKSPNPLQGISESPNTSFESSSKSPLSIHTSSGSPNTSFESVKSPLSNRFQNGSPTFASVTKSPLPKVSHGRATGNSVQSSLLSDVVPSEVIQHRAPRVKSKAQGTERRIDDMFARRDGVREGADRRARPELEEGGVVDRGEHEGHGSERYDKRHVFEYIPAGSETYVLSCTCECSEAQIRAMMTGVDTVMADMEEGWQECVRRAVLPRVDDATRAAVRAMHVTVRRGQWLVLD